MMTRSPDILFMSEYIKNVLYFATVRQGKVLKSTSEIHYFCTDNELVYDNYYSDFGPLNLGCVYKFCVLLNQKLKEYMNKNTIIYYTSTDPRKKANAAFLLGCYGVLYLNLTPKDAMKPLTLHGQTYRPFQDATKGDSMFTITIFDCLQAILKAQDLGFFDFNDFDYEEYERLDKLQGGDRNWIVPGKFLAFIGPVDSSVNLYHPPEMYIPYFLDNNVQVVIRLNKRMYDGNVFSSVGIIHYDLFFPDGSCPPRHILAKFLQISEETEGAIAVHCKAGLGRTGSLIGCYLIKHYRMTSHEAIGWMRICRPGSVIGHQQAWLEQLEPWLIKQGNLYRKRTFHDTEKLPVHAFGIYSINEQKKRYSRPVVVDKPVSPPPPIQRQTRSDISPPGRPQASKFREEDDISTASTSTMTLPQPETESKSTSTRNEVPKEPRSRGVPCWRKLLYYFTWTKSCSDGLFLLGVCCVKVGPRKCCASKLCYTIDRAAEKEHTSEWRIRTPKSSVTSKDSRKGELNRRSSGAGEPRNCTASTPTRACPTKCSTFRSSDKTDSSTISSRNTTNSYFPTPITTFRTTQGPILKTLNEARNFLLKSSLYNEQRDKQLQSALTVTPQYAYRATNYPTRRIPNTPPPVSPYVGNKALPLPQYAINRRKLGRSPSPSPIRMPSRILDQNRATNTEKIRTGQVDQFLNDSRYALKEALSRLKFVNPRDGSVGAGSLGAWRDAPVEKRAPSVRSDERPLATQGDMLNSIKFQRRLRDSMKAEKNNTKINPSAYIEKSNSPQREKITRENTAARLGFNPNSVSNSPKTAKETSTKNNTGYRLGFSQDGSRNPNASKGVFSNNSRPASPKGRRGNVPFY